MDDGNDDDSDGDLQHDDEMMQENEEEEDDGDDEIEEEDDENEDEEDDDNEFEAQLLRFIQQCDEVAANSSSVCAITSSREIPLNDEQAIRLGRALIGNTKVYLVAVKAGPHLTTVGIKAILGGIMGSNINTLFILGDENFELPIELAQLYTAAVQFVEHLHLKFSINDQHAAALGECLVNQTMTELYCYFDNITPLGAEALSNGIRASNIKQLQFTAWEQQRVSVQATQILFQQGVACSQKIGILSLSRALGDVHALAASLHAVCCLSIGEVKLTLGQIQILMSGVLREEAIMTRLEMLSLCDCGITDEHMRILSPAVGNHRHLQRVLLNDNEIGDAGVEVFVDNWSLDHSKIELLSFSCNRISSKGAHRLIRALSSRTAMKQLYMAQNMDIGFDGLKLIGKELPGKTLKTLQIYDVVNWVDYEDADCDEAVTQDAKRAQAGKALVEGVRENVYLERLGTAGMLLLDDDWDEIDVYIKANRCHRRLLREQHTLPLAFWCHFLAKQRFNRSLFFLFLRELPVLMMTGRPSAGR